MSGTLILWCGMIRAVSRFMNRCDYPTRPKSFHLRTSV